VIRKLLGSGSSARSAVVIIGILVLVPVAIAVTSSPAGAAPSSHASKDAAKFKITRFTLSPDPLIANGPDGTARIYWSGHPTFPVTIYDAPRSCPSGLICNALQRVFARSADPLVWKDEGNCEGTVPVGFVFRYWIWGVDAKGHKTAKFRTNIPCNNAG
jgi:hypothetical protein